MSDGPETTTRRRLDVAGDDFHPRYVVWELTLACDQPCTHCGSRAGDARESELRTDEALAVVAQLAAMRASEVVLIGGEAYLHPGFLSIVRALRDAGIRPTMTTGGRGITRALAAQMAAAGLALVSVSVDGLERAHDLMRATRGSFRAATEALAALREARIEVAANTNLNRLNRDDLEALYAHLRDAGVRSWQVQLTAPLGRAADRAAMLLQPYDLLDLLPRLAELKKRAYGEGVLILPGNNLGYFGPEEALLRSMTRAGRDHFAGCMAGRFVMGIESDGAVKGCPSLQTAHYVGGSLREQSLERIWRDAPAMAFTRERTVDSLWGFCRRCDFAEACLGGCTFTAHAILGRPGNNPYCHYRALVQRRRGVRERLVAVERAPGEPFDNGLFALVEEPFDTPEPPPEPREKLVQIRRAPVP